MELAGDSLAPFVLATIQVESGGNEYATNPKSGAAGLMQIIPSVYEKCGIKPYDAVENMNCGIGLIRDIRKLLTKIDPVRFGMELSPGEFERRIISAGYVKGWSLKAGVARDIKKYSGSDWQGFLAAFPEWNDTEPYVSIVADLTDKWTTELNDRLVASSKPSMRPIDEAHRRDSGKVSAVKDKSTITMVLGFFLLLSYLLIRNCDQIKILFK